MDRNHVLQQLVIMSGITLFQMILVVLTATDHENANAYLTLWFTCALVFWILFYRLVRTK